MSDGADASPDEPARLRTSGGVPLTDEVLDRLAREAEEGYDIASLRPRRAKVDPHD